MKRHGQLIRIRIERPGFDSGQTKPEGAGTALLTYKGPARFRVASNRSRTKPSDRRRFKILDEVEVVVASGEQMSRILTALGLEPAFRYEKYRTTYELPDVSGLKVEFDETPIGFFVELEGSPSLIDRAARLLGYSQADYVTESYGAFYLAECRRTKNSPSGMLLFRSTKKLC